MRRAKFPSMRHNRPYQNCTLSERVEQRPCCRCRDLKGAATPSSSCCNIQCQSAGPKARARQHLRPRSKASGNTRQGRSRSPRRHPPLLPMLPQRTTWKTLESRLAESDGRTGAPARRFRRSGGLLRVMRASVTKRRMIDRAQGLPSLLQSHFWSGFIFAALSS